MIEDLKVLFGGENNYETLFHGTGVNNGHKSVVDSKLYGQLAGRKSANNVNDVALSRDVSQFENYATNTLGINL